MKIKFLSIISVAAALVSLPSCDKFLDLTPVSDLTQSNAYQSASDAEAALVGCYDAFQCDYYTWDNVLYSDVRSDNHYAGGDNANIFEIDEQRIPATSTRVLGSWRNLYSAISRCNLVLAKVPGISDAKLDINNRRDQILGEVYFMRAYHYFQLVKSFGGVPLMLKPIESTDISVTNLARATEAEVYNQIIADLTLAVQKLPSVYSGDASVNKARATKGAANTLLAKVYAQKSDRDYAKVLEYCNNVINDKEADYQLLDNYDQLFDGNHYNNKESIIEMQYVGSTEGNWGPQMLLPPSLSGDSWRKFVTPSHNLVDAFDAAGDVKRKNATILMETVGWNDEYWAVGGGSVAFSYKWRSANGWASTNRQYLLRFADVILLKAEALNNLDRLDEAAVELNKIRKRAGLANTTAATKADMNLAIENERRLEFAQEAQRWDDMVRFGNAVSIMSNLKEKNLVTGQFVNYNMNADKLLLPIPQIERERNPLLVQNSGY